MTGPSGNSFRVIPQCRKSKTQSMLSLSWEVLSFCKTWFCTSLSIILSLSWLLAPFSVVADSSWIHRSQIIVFVTGFSGKVTFFVVWRRERQPLTVLCLNDPHRGHAFVHFVVSFFHFSAAFLWHSRKGFSAMVLSWSDGQTERNLSNSLSIDAFMTFCSAVSISGRDMPR